MRKKLCFFVMPLVSLSLILVSVGISAMSYILLKDNTIPSTLEECYIALDSVLTEEEKFNIKNAGNGNLFKISGFPDNRWNELIAEGFDPVDLDLSTTHFGLGLWIRNNWIYPSSRSNIGNRFIIAGIRHPDDISSQIITGYYLYLNGLSFAIHLTTKAIIKYAAISLIFISSIVIIIIGKRRN